MKHTPPPLDLPDSSILSIRNMENGKRGELCPCETKDVAVPHVLLEVDPEPDVIQLVIHGLNIYKQDTGVGGVSVSEPGTFPLVFLLPASSWRLFPLLGSASQRNSFCQVVLSCITSEKRYVALVALFRHVLQL